LKIEAELPMKKRYLMLALVAVAIALAACGGDDDENDEQRLPAEATLAVTLQPLPEQTIVPGCPPQELEDWFEATYFNMQTFLTESDASAGQADEARRPAVGDALGRLMDLRDRVARAPTPSCVQGTSGQILEAMQAVVEEFRQFADGGISESKLEERVSTHNQVIANELDVLLERIAPLYVSTPSTSSGN
jgi:hypothetical protein